jgi:flavin-dependent dehydrogenase
VGARIPPGSYVREPARGDVLLVGDAAGLVDPITGEGLYFALRSAELASMVVCDVWFGYRDGSAGAVAREYVRAVRQEIHRQIRKAGGFARRFIRPAAIRSLRGHGHVLAYFCDNLISRYAIAYRDMLVKYPLRYLFSRL